MLKAKEYLILGIATDIGKTFLVENLCLVLRKKNIAVNAIKPIASGFEDDDLTSDSAKILNVLNKKNLDEITPWRFKDAVSPHFAANNIGKEIDFDEVVNFCLEKISIAKKQDEFLFIEAAGGVMTPINDEKTFLDLAEKLRLPVLLVSANYLGSISHTLCAIEALKSRNVMIEKVVINENLSGVEASSGASIMQMIETVKSFSGCETVILRDLVNWSL